MILYVQYRSIVRMYGTKGSCSPTYLHKSILEVDTYLSLHHPSKATLIVGAAKW